MSATTMMTPTAMMAFTPEAFRSVPSRQKEDHFFTHWWGTLCRPWGRAALALSRFRPQLYPWACSALCTHRLRHAPQLRCLDVLAC